MGVEGKSSAEIDGRDEGRGGEGWRICCGGGPEIRRRLRGGGLTSGDGIVFGFTNTSGEAFVQKPLRLTLSYVVMAEPLCLDAHYFTILGEDQHPSLNATFPGSLPAS